jgi:hypothetical protein
MNMFKVDLVMFVAYIDFIYLYQSHLTYIDCMC